MNKTQLQSFRQMVIFLLDDQDGICEAGYEALRTVANFVDTGCCNDIFVTAQSADGRYYLPEDHGIIA